MKKKTYNHSHADHHKHEPTRRKLTRRQKNVFHWLLILIVSVLLLHEGAQLADWGFLLLAIVVEAS